MTKNPYNMDARREQVGNGEQVFFTSLRSQVLSTDEKDTLRQALRATVIDSQPKVFQARPQVANFFALFLRRSFVVSMLVLVLIVGSGYGIAQASNNALPGDLLYPMKTQFNEPFVGGLQASDTARAEWTRTLVERRIAEAEALAEQGRLGAAEKNMIEQQLAKHRNALDSFEGRTVTDEEFMPEKSTQTTQKINVYFDHTTNEIDVRIEERGAGSDGAKSGQVKGAEDKNFSGDYVPEGVKSKDGESIHAKSENTSQTNQGDQWKKNENKKDASSGKRDTFPEQQSGEQSQLEPV